MWESAQQEAFDGIKEEITKIPVPKQKREIRVLTVINKSVESKTWVPKSSKFGGKFAPEVSRYFGALRCQRREHCIHGGFVSSVSNIVQILPQFNNFSFVFVRIEPTRKVSDNWGYFSAILERLDDELFAEIEAQSERCRQK